MKKEDLIKKWLDNELSVEEMQAFQQLEEYDSYVKLSEKAHYFKAPAYNAEEAYKKLKPVIAKKRIAKKRVLFFKPLAQIAAVLVLGLLAYSIFFSSDLTTVETFAREKKSITLPDNSLAQLNALSTLSFDESNWQKERSVDLNGEAYFKVAKGARFDVETNSGVVSVLGTEFNVKNRLNYFEVQCFEGKVQVVYQDNRTVLTAGQTIRIVDGFISNPTTDLVSPSWIANKSSFQSVPYAEVLAEFERQYDVEIKTEMNTEVLFSGVFSHNNQTSALQSITIPFGLEYTIVNKQITLTKID